MLKTDQKTECQVLLITQNNPVFEISIASHSCFHKFLKLGQVHLCKKDRLDSWSQGLFQFGSAWYSRVQGKCAACVGKDKLTGPVVIIMEK